MFATNIFEFLGTFIIPFLLIIGLFISLRRNQQTQESLLRDVAIRIGQGNVEPQSRSISFTRDGHNARFCFFSEQKGRYSTGYTQLYFYFNKTPESQFEIHSKRFLDPLSKIFGNKGIKTGDPDLDQHFKIKCLKQHKIIHLLNDAIKKEIFELKKRAKKKHFVIKREGSSLFIQQTGWLYEAEEIKEFIENGYRLFQELKTTL